MKKKQGEGVENTRYFGVLLVFAINLEQATISVRLWFPQQTNCK
jgi:hypothetical protein